jgi:hypothetical protein
MTTARSLFARRSLLRRHVEGKLMWATLVVLLVPSWSSGQTRPTHWSHNGAMPPGAIGRQRLMRGGPLSGYCQPVAIRAPQTTRIAPAAGSGFGDSVAGELLVGLQVGTVTRFRVTDIPEHPGMEVYPTVELIDRLHPPAGQALHFPVPVDLTAEELAMAAEGKFVTRVIYVEDPQLALPIDAAADRRASWFEVAAGEDPLVAADGLGRPIAILRMGGRVPLASSPQDPGFNYPGIDPLVYDPPQPRVRPAAQSPTPAPLPSTGINR